VISHGGRLARCVDVAHRLGRRIIGMNKVLLVGRLTRDPELRTLPSGKAVANFVIAAVRP
jgi:hypothetical protein